MHLNRSLILPALLVALLGAVWVFHGTLGSGASEDDLLGLGDEVFAGDEDTGLSPLEDDDAVTPGAGDVGGRQEIFAAPEVDEGADAAAEAGADADSRLTGTVVRASGLPIEGARVVARRTQPWFSPPPDLEEMSAVDTEGPRHEALTDAAGRFELFDVPAGKLALGIRAPGMAPLERKGLEIPEHEDYDLGRFQMELGITLSGVVYGSRGKGQEGVQVLSAVTRDAGYTRLELPGHGIPLVTTDPDGKFEVDGLAPGGWHLIFDSPAHRVAELKGETEPAGNTDRSLMVTLEQGLSIEGTVTGLRPGPGEELRVTARRDDEQPSGAADEVEGSERYRPRHGPLLADGSWAVRGLAPGVQYKLRLYRRTLPDLEEEPQGNPGRWRTVRGVEDAVEMAGARKVEFKYREEAVVLLQVQNQKTGSPISRFYVHVRGDDMSGDGTLEDEEGEPLEKHPGGSARFEGLLPAETGRSTTVRVRSEGFVDFEKKGAMLRPGQELDLGVVELEPAPTGEVKVVDEATGEPVAGARVVFARAADTKSLGRWIGMERRRPLTDAKVRDAVTNGEGIAELTLWKGSIVVMKAFAEGYQSGEEERHVPPYDKVVEMGLVRGGRITVKVVDGEGRPVPGMYVQHKVDGKSKNNRNFWSQDSGQENKTGDEGTVAFVNLPEGQHSFTVLEKLNAWGSGGESAGFEAEGDVFLKEGAEQELELRVATRGGLHATILESGQPLKGALVKVTPVEGGPQQTMWFSGGGGDDPRSKISDHTGRVEFAGLKTGRYDLRVSHGDRRMVVSREVLILAEPDELVIDVGLAVIEGRCIDHEGRPIEGVSITVYEKDSRNRHHDMNDYRVRITEDEDGDADWNVDQVKPWSIRSDEDGRFTLRGVAPEVLLQVQASDRYVVGGNKEVGPLGSDEYVTPFDFVMHRAGALRVSVSGVDSRERGRMRVRLVRMEGDQEKEKKSSRLRSWRSYTTISSLRPGTWKLRLTQDKAKEPLLEREVVIEVEKTTRLTLNP